MYFSFILFYLILIYFILVNCIRLILLHFILLVRSLYMCIYNYIISIKKKNTQCDPCFKQGPHGRWMPSGILCWVPTHPTALATPCHTPHKEWCRTVVAPCERHSPASWRTFETARTTIRNLGLSCKSSIELGPQHRHMYNFL